MSGISENLFQAIDNIVSARLNEVSFDRTIVGTIVGIEKDILNTYWVKTDTLRFQAKSEDTEKTYDVDDMVYVRIPNGDYSMQKIITGRYTAEEISKTIWTNPFEDMNYGAKWEILNSDDFSVSGASKSNTTTYNAQGKYLSAHNFINENGFNYIGIDFALATEGFDGRYKGAYAIQFDLLNGAGTTLFTDKIPNHLVISSEQLYGNPYYLTPELRFQHLFPYPEGIKPGDIKKIKITLIANDEVPAEASITLTSVFMYFGYQEGLSAFAADNSLIIELKDKNEKTDFDTNNPDTKELGVTWMKNRALNSPSGLVSTTEQLQNYQIKWYHYQLGVTEDTDNYGGDYWVLRKTGEAKEIGSYSYSFTPRTSYAKEQVKALVVDKTTSKVVLRSSIMNFEATNSSGLNPDQQTNQQLELTFESGSQHFIYGNSGKIESGEAKDYKVSFSFRESTLRLLNGDVVTWSVEEGSQVEGFRRKKPDNKMETVILHSYTVDEDALEPDCDNYQEAIYRLHDVLFKAGNSKITCTVNRPGIFTATGEVYITTGNKNTIGTGYKFNIDFAESSPQCVTAKDDVTIKATLISPEGKPVDLTGNKLTWSWADVGQLTTKIKEEGKDDKYSYTEYEFFGYKSGANRLRLSEKPKDKAKDYDQLSTTSDTITICQLTDKAVYKYYNTTTKDFEWIKKQISDLQEDEEIKIGNKTQYKTETAQNFHILRAEYKDAAWAYEDDGAAATTTLFAYLPIPWGSSKDFELLGPDLVTYSPSGQEPEYIKDPYKIKKGNNKLSIDKDNLTIITRGGLNEQGPTIRGIENKDITLYYLSPRASLLADTPDSVIYYKDGNNWYQHPLFITKNTYMFDAVNKWSGRTVIDEENNRIMTGFLVAGRKNKTDNTFTGVMMGDFQAQDPDGRVIDSGILGQKNGETRFKLGTDGSFYVGTGDDNKINFSSNGNLSITSKVFNLHAEDSNYYMSLNSSAVGNEGSYCIDIGKKNTGTQDPYFYVNGKGKIFASGAEIAGKIIMSSDSTYNDGTKLVVLKDVIKDLDDDLEGVQVTLGEKNSIYTSTAQAGGKYIKGDLLIPTAEEGTFEKNGIYRATQNCSSKANPKVFVSEDWVETMYVDAQKLADDIEAAGTTLLTGLGYQKTEINSKYIIAPAIGGGYLNISGNGSSVLIDPNYISQQNQTNKYIFRITNGEGTAIGLKSTGDATFNGQITATQGSDIAGWKTTQYQFGKVSGGYGIGLDHSVIGTDSKAFGIGEMSALDGSWSDCDFYVTGKGAMYAKAGEIAGWTIKNNALINVTNGNAIILNNKSTDTNMLVLGLSANSIEDVYEMNSWSSAKFRVTRDGKLYAKEASINGTIEAGTILADGVGLGNGSYTKIEDYYYGNGTGEGTHWYRLNADMEFFLWYGGTVDGYKDFDIVGMSCHRGEILCQHSSYLNQDIIKIKGDRFDNQAVEASASLTASDIRIKNTINNLQDKYEILFNNLSAVSYKYNEGTSGRTHIGFIAQEVKTALDMAKISSQEFAGFVIHKPNTEKETWALRYDEFIALNTWQIQKAKARITELEKQVAELKALI